MNPTIAFINENTVKQSIEYIEENQLDIENVIQKSIESRTEYSLKVQELIDRLTIKLGKLDIGTILEAKEDCMNNFRKCQRVEITDVEREDYVIDGVVGLDEKTIRKFFVIIGQRET